MSCDDKKVREEEAKLQKELEERQKQIEKETKDKEEENCKVSGFDSCEQMNKVIEDQEKGIISDRFDNSKHYQYLLDNKDLLKNSVPIEKMGPRYGFHSWKRVVRKSNDGDDWSAPVKTNNDVILSYCKWMKENNKEEYSFIKNYCEEEVDFEFDFDDLGLDDDMDTSLRINPLTPGDLIGGIVMDIVLEEMMEAVAVKVVKTIFTKAGRKAAIAFGSKILAGKGLVMARAGMAAARMAAAKFAVKIALKINQKIGAKLAAKLGVKLAQKAGAKMGVKVVAATGKAATKAAMGPVGWALLAFDVFSIALDLCDIMGFASLIPDMAKSNIDLRSSFIKADKDALEAYIKEQIKDPEFMVCQDIKDSSGKIIKSACNPDTVGCTDLCFDPVQIKGPTLIQEYKELASQQFDTIKYIRVLMDFESSLTTDPLYTNDQIMTMFKSYSKDPLILRRICTDIIRKEKEEQGILNYSVTQEDLDDLDKRQKEEVIEDERKAREKAEEEGIPYETPSPKWLVTAFKYFMQDDKDSPYVKAKDRKFEAEIASKFSDPEHIKNRKRFLCDGKIPDNFATYYMKDENGDFLLDDNGNKIDILKDERKKLEDFSNGMHSGTYTFILEDFKKNIENLKQQKKLKTNKKDKDEIQTNIDELEKSVKNIKENKSMFLTGISNYNGKMIESGRFKGKCSFDSKESCENSYDWVKIKALKSQVTTLARKKEGKCIVDNTDVCGGGSTKEVDCPQTEAQKKEIQKEIDKIEANMVGPEMVYSVWRGKNQKWIRPRRIKECQDGKPKCTPNRMTDCCPLRAIEVKYDNAEGDFNNICVVDNVSSLIRDYCENHDHKRYGKHGNYIFNPKYRVCEPDVYQTTDEGSKPASKFCTMYGADLVLNADENIYECEIPKGQEVAEVFVGETITRTFKLVFDPNMRHSCNPLDADDGLYCSIHKCRTKLNCSWKPYREKYGFSSALDCKSKDIDGKTLDPPYYEEYDAGFCYARCINMIYLHMM